MKRSDQQDRAKRVDPALKRGREYHRLWYEYLRRSDTYRDLCDWLHEHPDIKARIGIGPVVHLALTVDGPGYKKDWDNLVRVYHVFGDVRCIPFDLRWVFINGMLPPTSDRHRDLRVDLDREFSVIEKAIKALYKERRQKVPMRKEQHVALGKYLQAYDIYQARDGRKWRAKAIRAIFNVGPDHSHYDNRQRLVDKYLECARRIIQNVERGEFPGKY